MIEREIAGRSGLVLNVENEPLELLNKLTNAGIAVNLNANLFDDRAHNSKVGPEQHITPADICPELRGAVLELARQYGYEWEQPAIETKAPPVIKAIITTLDNLPNLQESIPVLLDEPIDKIVVVNNGSRDGTREWLATQPDLTVVNRQNLGAGPGRNAGQGVIGAMVSRGSRAGGRPCPARVGARLFQGRWCTPG